jgi:hypothetical protein
MASPSMTPGHRSGQVYNTRAGAPDVHSDPPVMQAGGAATPGSPGTMHQGRGSAALWLADRILAQAQASPVTREDVTPEFEPESPSITTEEEDEDFVDNEDVTPDMEPYDATIESALDARLLVEGDEDQVTITAEEGETIVAVTEDDEGDLVVEVEDTSDVLLSP